MTGNKAKDFSTLPGQKAPRTRRTQRKTILEKIILELSRVKT